MHIDKKIWVILLLAGLFLPGRVAHAQNTDSIEQDRKKLLEIEHNIKKNEKKQRKINQTRKKARAGFQDINKQLAGRGQALHKLEAQITTLEQKIHQLSRKEERQRLLLEQKTARLNDAWLPLIRLSDKLPFFLTVFPNNALDIVRGRIIINSVIPPLEADTKSLKADLESLAHVQKDLTSQKNRLDEKNEDLAENIARLETLTAKKRTLYQEISSDYKLVERKILALSQEASELRQFLSQLNDSFADQRKNTPGFIKPFPKKGPLRSPTQGKIIRNYNARNERGGRDHGVTVKTNKRAHIVAPHDGLAVFSGPFGNYGKILIIEHKQGYHTVLSGMNRLYVTSGQWIITGEPVGRMLEDNTQLYVELRHRGKHINPSPWIRF